ncbi:hypothetical protein NBRC116493_18620 [Aurantivibrio infirmus]
MNKPLLFTLLTLLSVNVGADEIYGELSGGDVELDYGSREVDDKYFRIGVGIQLSDHISLETGLWDLGSGRDRGVRISAKTIYAAVKVGADLGGGLEWYCRGGAHHWDRDIGSDDDDGRDLFFGAGLALATPVGKFALEFHRLDLDEVDATTFGIAYRLPLGF